MSIIELILLPIFNFVLWFIGILPRVSLPADFFSSVDLWASLIISLGYFLPLPTLISIITLYISYYFLKLTIQIVIFIIQFIPIIRTKVK